MTQTLATALPRLLQQFNTLTLIYLDTMYIYTCVAHTLNVNFYANKCTWMDWQIVQMASHVPFGLH